VTNYALGKQDIASATLQPPPPLKILGASSDHLILSGQHKKIEVGQELQFSLDYGGLLAAMTSPFVEKRFI
jgi:ornithine racemase